MCAQLDGTVRALADAEASLKGRDDRMQELLVQLEEQRRDDDTHHVGGSGRVKELEAQMQVKPLIRTVRMCVRSCRILRLPCT